VYGVPPEKIAVIHSGVAAHKLTEKKSRLSLPDSYILYLGTLEPRKNVPSVIEAFSALADKIPHDLVIAGASGWLMKDFNRALEASAVKDRIRVLGPVTEAEKQALYAGASVFVYPSFYEGFGFPPLEALLAGTPVITSHNSALPEIVGKWATLIDPYNPAELAQVILEILREDFAFLMFLT